MDKNGKIVRDFLFLAFTEPTSAKYAFTTAIAEVFLRADELAGLLYPAVSKFANVDNLALRPEFVRDNMRLETAQLVKIDEIGTDKSVGGEILFDLTNVGDDGTLHWKAREIGVSVPPKSSHQIQIGESLRVQSAGEIEVDGKRYYIEPGYQIEFNEMGFFISDLRGNPIGPIS